MTGLQAACDYLGWQGGTVHQARKALEVVEGKLIQDYAKISEEKTLKRIAVVQVLLENLAPAISK